MLGDFRCDNLIFHPAESRIIAVLDWELSTLGNPLADFAYHALMYRMPPDIVAGLRCADIAALGIPSEEDYIQAYCERTGRSGIAAYDFYIAFNLFRLAAILHGIKGRLLRWTAASQNARNRVSALQRVIALALEAIEAARGARCEAGPWRPAPPFSDPASQFERITGRAPRGNRDARWRSCALRVRPNCSP